MISQKARSHSKRTYPLTPTAVVRTCRRGCARLTANLAGVCTVCLNKAQGGAADQRAR